MAKIIFLIIVVISGTLWMYLLHYFAPKLSVVANSDSELKFPSNIKELQGVAATLQAYSVDHWWYVLLIFSSAYIYKQAFCIPGSLFLNILAGALYGHIGGIFFACFFTAIGATLCYLLSRIFAEELVVAYFPKRFKNFQEKVKANKDNLFYFMLFIRLIPIAPGWVVNIIAPLVKVPIVTFFVTTLIGLGPYNFVGVSAGQILSSLKSVNDVFTWKIFFNITAIGLVAIVPSYILRSASVRKTQKNKIT